MPGYWLKILCTKMLNNRVEKDQLWLEGALLAVVDMPTAREV